MTDSDLVIVAYHYVRPLSRTRFPRIKGCELGTFARQIESILEHFEVISADDLVAFYESAESLPDRAALLTFDDGLRDHFDYVLPILVDKGITGCFYPPAAPIVEHRLLDVHKVHFLLAVGPDPSDLCEMLDEMIVDRSLGDPAKFALEYRHPSPRDSAEVVYVKRMLQKGLPEADRAAMADELFAAFVSGDQAAFAEELYCTKDQLQLMRSVGMHVGSHGYEHYWLTTLADDAQREDLEKSVAFIEYLTGGKCGPLSICYPYGDHSDVTIRTAIELGFTFGLSDHHGFVDLRSSHRWALPRVSTSDLLIG